MTQNLPLDDDDPVGEGFFDAVQEMQSGALVNFKPYLLSPTSVRLDAGDGHDQVSVSIDGQYRWVDEPITRAHPGGAAGIYALCATADENEADTGRPAGGDSSFALAIVGTDDSDEPVADAPAGVDIYRVTHWIVWSGAAIIGMYPAEAGDMEVITGAVTAGGLTYNSRGVASIVKVGVGQYTITPKAPVAGYNLTASPWHVTGSTGTKNATKVGRVAGPQGNEWWVLTFADGVATDLAFTFMGALL